jgi:signal transduction histidine kinase
MTFRTKVVAGFAAGLAIFIGVCLLSYRSLARNSEDIAWVTHTHVVLEKLDAVQGNLTDAESGERGYIITEQEAYLAPYNDACNHVHDNLQDLRVLTSDNPVQQKNLDALEPSVTSRLIELQDRIDMRSKMGMAPVADVIRRSSALSEVNHIREQIETMRLEEDRLLKERSAAVTTSSHRTRVVMVVGDALALSLLCLAAFVVRQEMEQRSQAEENVRQLNAGLEQRIAERTAELDERAKDLARSNSELQQFAYVASHDLQEPLRMVASFTQLLAKRYSDKLDDDARDFINYAVDGATRMQTLISDLLSYSRVGTQGKALQQTRCDDALDHALRNLKFLIEESGARITREPLPVALADSIQMSQLFQNLIANAIKFRGKDAPKVRISAARNSGTWTISVRDNGIGIHPEYADRIFVIFQRLHTKAEYPGTGIGLAVCKKIVERHGGRIWVEPNPDEGSTFYFTLPAVQVQKGEIDYDELRIAAASR